MNDETPQDVLTQNRLTTREIAQNAHWLAERFGGLLGLPNRPSLIAGQELNHWEDIVRAMLLECHNPNGIMLVAKNHDEEVARKLKDGWRYGEITSAEEKTHPELLPFLQLPPETRAKALFFRQTVVALHPFWAQH